MQERVKVVVVLVQNHGFHFDRPAVRVARLAARFGTELPLPGLGQRASEGDRLLIDLAANARSLGAHVIEVHSQAELEQAIKEAKASADRPVVIHVETDPLVHAPDSASWWDVPVSAVSELDSTQTPTASTSTTRPRNAPHHSRLDQPGDRTMKLAIDPYMFRETPCSRCRPRRRARLRVDRAEPREDFTLLQPPRVDDTGVAAFRKALAVAGVGLARSCRSTRGRDPTRRTGRPGSGYWKRDPDRLRPRRRHDELRVQRQPASGGSCERMFWRSMDELLPPSRGGSGPVPSSRTRTTGRRTASEPST